MAKNNNEEITEVEEVKPEVDMEVIVPKSEMVVMPPEKDETFDAHLLSFANFYVKMFKTDNLEVMEDFDKNASTMEINEFILQNVTFKRHELAEKLLMYFPEQVKTLLADIKKDSKIKTDKFTAFSQWEDWYEEVRSTGKTAMS